MRDGRGGKKEGLGIRDWALGRRKTEREATKEKEVDVVVAGVTPAPLGWVGWEGRLWKRAI
jgi:hypothetical protein